MLERRNPYHSPRTLPGETGPGAGVEDASGELRPFKTIWLSPRLTVRRIIAVNPALHVVVLVCVAGVGQVLDRASLRNLGDTMPTAAIVISACIFGPLVGLFGLWLSSHLIRFTGEWIGGAGNRDHIKTALAWASVPAVFALPLWIPNLLLLGSDMFTAEMPRMAAQPWLLIPFIAFGLVELILAVWGFVVLCNTIAEVQGFRSAWRGLGNLLLAGIVLIVPLFMVFFVLILARAS